MYTPQQTFGLQNKNVLNTENIVELSCCRPIRKREAGCYVSGYPYVNQDHLAAEHVNRLRKVTPVTVDGKTVTTIRPEYIAACECKLDPCNLSTNSEALRFEIKGGVLKRGCDCIKKNGLQDYCPRRKCQGRPECLAYPGPVCEPSGGQHQVPRYRCQCPCKRLSF
uniref:Uncharacterized protein n=1 Tax=Clastoptera arizonana TaxID=38151 RepID=A0A1B6DGM2_9HEMI